MRFDINKNEPYIGQIKTKKCFALFPVLIGSSWVWLEFFNKQYQLLNGF